MLVVTGCLLLVFAVANAGITGGAASASVAVKTQTSVPLSRGALASSPLLETATLAKPQSFLTQFSSNARDLMTGFSKFGDDLKEQLQLRSKKRQFGLSSFNYDEYQTLARSTDDNFRIIRLGAMMPLYKNWFWLSNFIMPLTSPPSPVKWKHLPSSFTSAEHKEQLQAKLKDRKQQTLLRALLTLKDEAVDSIDGKQSAQKARILSIIDQSLHSVHDNIDVSLKALEPFYTTHERSGVGKGLFSRFATARRVPVPEGNVTADTTSGPVFVSGTKMSLQLGKTPNSITSQLVRALGGDAAPDFPLIRSFNRVTASKQLNALRSSDEFLLSTGLWKQLKPEQLRHACALRGIGLTNKSVETLRQDLSEWFSLMASPPLRSGVRVNDQNKRLALMALQVAREAKVSGFTQEYRSLFGSS